LQSRPLLQRLRSGLQGKTVGGHRADCAPTEFCRPHFAHLSTSFKRFRFELNRKGSKFERYLFSTGSGIRHLQCVHPQHPPDEEYRNDGPCDVNDPVASCFRFSEIEHTQW